VADNDDDDVDLINLNDPDDHQDSDTDQDFPWGEPFVLHVVPALIEIGAMTLLAETRTRPQRDCLLQCKLIQTTFLWHPLNLCPMSVAQPLLRVGEGYPHRIPQFGEGLRARIPDIHTCFLRATQNPLCPATYPIWTARLPAWMTKVTIELSQTVATDTDVSSIFNCSMMIRNLRHCA